MSKKRPTVSLLPYAATLWPGAEHAVVKGWIVRRFMKKLMG